jgi:hypothetical protein
MLHINGKRVWEVVCERCGGVIHVHGNKNTAVRELRGYGWAVGRKCLCPACRETPQGYHRHDGSQRKL